MTSDRVRRSITLLRWVLGVVILAQAARFAFSRSAAAEFAKTGMPDFVHLALAWGEMAAATLFLIPALVSAGGRLLLAILGCAIVLHLLRGWLDVGVLVVYAAATWAVVTANAQSAPELAKKQSP